MTVIFFILILVACVILAFFVLIQNPEGGGLSSSVGGFSNQIMGVKKTNNFLEKGTWLFAGIIALLCVISLAMFTGANSSSDDNALKQLNTNVPTQQQQAAPAPTQPAK